MDYANGCFDTPIKNASGNGVVTDSPDTTEVDAGLDLIYCVTLFQL